MRTPAQGQLSTLLILSARLRCLAFCSCHSSGSQLHRAKPEAWFHVPAPKLECGHLLADWRFRIVGSRKRGGRKGGFNPKSKIGWLMGGIEISLQLFSFAGVASRYAAPVVVRAE